MRLVPRFCNLANIFVPGIAKLEMIIAAGIIQIRREVVEYRGKALAFRLCCGT